MADQINVALLTEYDGSAFCGWQNQPQIRTVQQTLEDTLRELTDDAEIRINGCSRTDSGVHARGHVSSFQTRTQIPVDRLPLALNTQLPPDLAVKAACPVSDDFHARFSARGKMYSYTYWHSTSRPVLERSHACHITGRFDPDSVSRAMPYLIGEHDFSALMDSGGVCNSPVRRIDELSLQICGAEIKLYVRGSGFLYHMVRILAGTLLYVAQGKIDPDQIPQILQIKDRRRAGKTMPPCGLCLEHVYYAQRLFAGYKELLEEKRDYHVQYALE